MNTAEFQQRKNTRRYQITGLQNTRTEPENILEGFNSRVKEASKRIGDLEDRAVELTQREQQREKRT